MLMFLNLLNTFFSLNLFLNERIRLCNPLFLADFREILESRDFCRHPNKEDSGGWRKKLNFSFVQVEDSSLICLPWAIACLSQTMI